ncbi:MULTISPECIES: rhodanese-like domain-containing protein [Desulfosediminicola]|uniref:rhodanese-like domain-containing protein n=1 Tax=Desulfosediminicola TaxID=2886823 RepID=UPI0010AC276A|nr:rhodanese-like domain-containing protein [Desulfosediminicola ganghwensis]
MRSSISTKLVAAAFVLALVSSGLSPTNSFADSAKQPAAAQQQAQNVYKGPVVGKSNKAKTISIQVGKGDAAKTMMVRFDDQTKGIEFAKKGEAAIITWEQRGEDKFATLIKPKLAKLPEGVTEIKVDEIHELLASATPLTLVDARPLSRYHQAHIPGAISIPVAKLKEKKAEVLPDDKDKLLVFYCGGPT